MSIPSDVTGCSPGEWPASEADARQGHESGHAIQHDGIQPPNSCLGSAGLAAGCGREAAAPAPAGLPCQNSNNSDKPTKRYRLKKIPGLDNSYLSKDNDRAIWKQTDGDTLERIGMPSGAEAKSAFHLRLNVSSFVERWARNHCLFFTVTDEGNLHPSEFGRRWNHYLRRHGQWIISFIRVLEPQKQGRPHYHLLVAVAWDTKPDAFDWQAFDECQKERRSNGRTARFRELRARYKASAAPELVAMWNRQPQASQSRVMRLRVKARCLRERCNAANSAT